MANGDFSSSNILNIQSAMDQMAADRSNVFRVYSNPARQTFLAMRNNNINEGIFSGVENPDKEISVDVHWLEKTGVAAGSCATDCDFGLDPGGSYKETFTLSKCAEDGYSYTDATWRGSQYDNEDMYKAAMNIQVMAALVAKANTDAIAFLEANFGTSNFLTEYNDNGSNEILVPASSQNAALWAHIAKQKELNDMDLGFLVSGLALHTTDFVAAASTDASARNMLGDTPLYFDLKGLASDTDNPFWLVDPRSYATVWKNRYDATGRNLGYDRRAYSLADPFGYGLTFDVIEKISCNTDETTKVEVKIKARYDYFLSPVSKVSTTNKGILKFITT